MTHWETGITSSPTTKINCSGNNKGGSKIEKELDTGETEDDDDFHSESLSSYLLFPKESPLKEPLFPTSRKKFLIMTCKRTLFACRSLILLCLIVFIIISFVSSHNANGYKDNVDDRSINSTTSSLNKSSVSISKNNASNTNHDHHYESMLLPPSINVVGNLSELLVNFSDKCSYRNSDYAVVGNALRKGLDYYEANADNITVLDASLGAKIVAEQLKQIQKSHKSLPLSLKTFLHDLEAKANTLAERIAEIVKKTSNSSGNLNQTLPWVETKDLWNLPAEKWHPVGKLESYNPPEDESFEELWNIASQKEVINEDESDACISQVFHCDVESITKNCENVFLSVERSMYSLTHQVIYMLLAQKNKCFEKKVWKQVSSLSQKGYPFLEKLCGKVWQEANSIMEANYPPRFRDLFIEQIGMCALAGYSDFLRRDWLRRIISWQSISSSGCFGIRKRRVPTIGMLLREYQRIQDEEVNYSRHHHQKQRRFKRSDIILGSENDQEKCSIHYTSVGITALSLHLRYFFDTCLDSY